MTDRLDGGRSPASSFGRTRSRAHTDPADPLTPYRILVVVQVTAALLAGLLGAIPAADPELRRADTAIALALLAFSTVVWFVLPRFRDDIGLDIAITIDICIAGFAAAFVPLQSGQFEVGLGLVIFGVFAAYFRPRRRFLAHLLFIAVAWTAGAAINPRLPTVTDVVVVLLAICGISLMVSTMAERLRSQALYDSLTGTLNRRGLELLAAPVAATAARTGTPISLAMIDLDSFKAYNDEHGHIAGDLLLADLTDAWQRQLRVTDLIARYGGDEFALVRGSTSEAEARELVSRLTAAHPARWSAGFGLWHPGEDLYDALADADRALFVAKRSRTPLPQQPGPAGANDGGTRTA